MGIFFVTIYDALHDMVQNRKDAKYAKAVSLCVLCAFAVYSLFFVSIQIVTGPSFSNSTFISAPNSPVPTGLPS